ncbi:MAG: DNA polymerase III subunit beta [Verrucomicrobiales bacterium]|jgi:DNA polymerase-3 subunit beta|nr:DNA polymerase III subunit beta [Verrucomicrobiales bacterium]|tara:strand:+ start:10092 stop:11186 length:1095 start_codon:yes stop_codon:yes gene_type:complete
MKFQIDKDVFQEALNQVQHVVSTRTTLPILSNVLIEADELGLQLSTTDLDVTITKRIAANITETGATTLPVRRLASIVRELPTSEITFEESDDAATVRSGPSFFKMLGLPAGEFPAIGEFGEAKDFTIDQKLLKEALRKTSYAISTDETRYVLNGVNCLIGEGMLTLVATDGRRLAMVEQDLEFPAGNETAVIIPTKAVNELQRLLDDSGELKVALTDSQAGFELNDSNLITKLIEGNYPNFRQVIPGNANHRVTVERETLHSAVKRVSLLANEKTNSIKFTFEDHRLAISSNSPEIGEAEEVIDVRYDGPKIVVAFNPEFVMAPLRNLDQDEVFIDLIDESSPGVIKIDEPFLYVIMPMRVAN